jgi:peptidoglycan-N-acetylglucosamine deacetylase
MLALAVTAASATVAVAAGYQSMSPTGQWYGPTFIGSPCSTQLALTFDDGPNDPHTLRLLDVLAKHNVHATFFLIGRYAEHLPQVVREISAAGHTIGNHTFSHPLLIFKSEQEIRRELLQCQSTIEAAIGAHSNLFRPPFGGRRPAVLHVARQLSFQTIMWNITGYDWNAPPAAEIEKKISRRIRGGDVILLHDGGHNQIGADRSQTILATDRVLSKYKKDGGFEFVTIPKMIRGTLLHPET